MRRFSSSSKRSRCAALTRRLEHPHGGVVRQFHDMQHQRHGLVAGVVGAMPEVHARALHAARRACDQVAHGDVE